MDDPFDGIGKNPNRSVHFSRSATAIIKPPLSEEEFAEEYIPDVPLTDSLRHAEAVNEVLRRRNVRPEGPAPEQRPEEWMECIVQAEEEVTSGQSCGPSPKPAPPPPEAAKVPPPPPQATPQGIALLPQVRIRLSFDDRYEENPTCSTCSEDPSPLFINQRYNPAWGVDDDAPGEEMAEDDLPSLHESQMEPPPDLSSSVDVWMQDQVAPGSWSSEEPPWGE